MKCEISHGYANTMDKRVSQFPLMLRLIVFAMAKANCTRRSNIRVHTIRIRKRKKIIIRSGQFYWSWLEFSVWMAAERVEWLHIIVLHTVGYLLGFIILWKTNSVFMIRPPHIRWIRRMFNQKQMLQKFWSIFNLIDSCQMPTTSASQIEILGLPYNTRQNKRWTKVFFLFLLRVGLLRVVNRSMAYSRRLVYETFVLLRTHQYFLFIYIYLYLTNGSICVPGFLCVSRCL